jgi:pantothenate kinase
MPEEISRGVARHRVVVVEGNYLLMGEGEWTALADIFDERWCVSSSNTL